MDYIIYHLSSLSNNFNQVINLLKTLSIFFFLFFTFFVYNISFNLKKKKKLSRNSKIICHKNLRQKKSEVKNMFNKEWLQIIY
jgi:hypothetical protein